MQSVFMFSLNNIVFCLKLIYRRPTNFQTPKCFLLWCRDPKLQNKIVKLGCHLQLRKMRQRSSVSSPLRSLYLSLVLSHVICALKWRKSNCSFASLCHTLVLPSWSCIITGQWSEQASMFALICDSFCWNLQKNSVHVWHYSLTPLQMIDMYREFLQEQQFKGFLFSLDYVSRKYKTISEF